MTFRIQTRLCTF